MKFKKDGLKKTVVMPDRTLVLSKKEKSPSSFLKDDEVSRRYKIRRIIGRGGFGIVYLADDMKIGRLVALKQLYDKFSGDEEIFERFMQEARIAGRLEHPNIIILYNIEEHENGSYMVMEYLGAGSLADFMLKQPKMELRTAIQIMLGILTGLEAAHNLMVVHRDIKPQNILFGFGGTPKITDFGIAHLPVNAGGAEILEKEKSAFMGTPVYMAPEQVLGLEVDCRADIYSAGALFYQMLTDEKIVPVHSELKLEEIREIVPSIKPQPIRDLRDDVPDYVADIIEKMTAKKVVQRYGTANDVKRDLVQALTKLKIPDGGLDVNNAFPTTLFWSTPAAVLEDILYLLLVDGKISPAERWELDKRIEQLGISDSQAKIIEGNVRRRLNLPSLDDLRIYADELSKCLTNDGLQINNLQQQKLKELQTHLKIEDDEIETIKTRIVKKRQ